MSEEYIQNLKRQSAKLEYEYWKLRVEIVKKDKELHDKMIKYFEEDLGLLNESELDIGIENE